MTEVYRDRLTTRKLKAKSLGYQPDLDIEHYCTLDRKHGKRHGSTGKSYNVTEEDASSDDTLEYMELFSDDFDE